MSAILYIGGVLYLLAVIQTTGKRWDADFHAWQTRLHDLTVGSVLEPKRLNIATTIQKALEP